METQTLSDTCKNCQAPIQGNFCAVCGQKTTVSKITIKETLQEIIDMFFSVNAPLLVTLKYLCIHPGKLFREFIAGKRKTYYKPVGFFLLMTVVYVLASYFFESAASKEELLQNLEQSANKLAYKAGSYMRSKITNFLFLFVFTMGISLKLLFRKRYSLAEYLSVSFYLVGMYVLLVSCSIYFMNDVATEWRSLPLFFMLFYYMYAMLSFFQKRTFKTIVKLVLAYILTVFLYILSSFGLSVLIILM